jgi:apolipoprotein N-acyltransferase
MLGKVEEHEKDSFVAGYLTKTVPFPQASTFYTRYGDVWAYGNLVVTVLFLLVAIVGIKHGSV